MAKKRLTEEQPLQNNILITPESDTSLSPTRHTGLRIKKIPKASAGAPAVKASLYHSAKYLTPGNVGKIMFRLNQKGGVDCPGCAWPDPDDERSKLGEYCENGVKAIAEEAQKKSIGRDFFATHPVAELLSWSDFQLGKSGRLAEPLLLRDGTTHYEPISWDDAFQLIATELQRLKSPDEAVFYTSGRTSNEAAFLYQLFVRAFGTNNLPDCSNLCHEASGVAMRTTLGSGKGTVALSDFHEADLILCFGQNPGTNHPRMLSALEKCKKNGGKIIAVNPLVEPGLLRFDNPQTLKGILGSGTPLADLYLQVKINGDIALLKAILLLLLYAEKSNPGSAFDMDFVLHKTEGYEAFATELQSHDFNDLAEASGVTRADIKKAVAMIAKAKKIIVCWAMGLTQHFNGVNNVKEIINLLLAKGAIGKPGAGACPVRGHSNVQGDRTMGIWESPSPQFLDALEKTFGFTPPRHNGYSTVEAIQAMYEGKASVFFGLGGNFLSASPDTYRTAEALRRCSLTVHVSTKLNRSHLIHGRQALILPCLARTDRDIQKDGEQFVSTENSMAVVQMSKGVINPASKHLLSEPAIIARLAKTVLNGRFSIDWDGFYANYDNIRNTIERVIPGFENYNERVRKPGGFYLPNPPKDQIFPTDSGKAKFSVVPVPKTTIPDGHFIMMTIRSHDQFNTTIYGLDDRYRGVFNERRVLLINKKDMQALGFKAKQAVNLISEYNGTVRKAENFLLVPYNIPRQCTATYFPEANVLVALDAFDPESKTPASKMVFIRIEAVDTPKAGGSTRLT
jgi:molybdopterin-dependent oxidoreductase alpha subunit